MIYHYVSNKEVRGITFAELDSKSNELSNTFCVNGSLKDKTVLIYQNKSIENIISILAVLKAGGVFCYLNPRITPSQLKYFIEKSDSHHVIIDKSTLISINRTKKEFNKDHSFIYYSLEEPSGFVHKIFESAKTYINLDIFQEQDPKKANTLTDCDVVRVQRDGGRPACCLFTSGTTGEPKGVLISLDDLSERVMTEVQDYRITPSDRLLSLLPFSFDVGLNQLFSSLMTGAHIAILNSWFPRDIFNAVKKLEITGISGVPYIWANLLNIEQGSASDFDIGLLRYITVSGGSLNTDQLDKLGSYFNGVDIYKTYGQTETFRSTILKPKEFHEYKQSTGRPVHGTTVLIIDSNGKIAGPDEEGEVIHKGPGTMIGYMGEDNDTALKTRDFTFTDSPEHDGRYVCTGDIGRFDKDGFMYLLRRKDDMIKARGYRVYPGEVENAILQKQEVKEAAVFGVKDEIMGQLILAEVVLNAAIDPKELIVFLNELLPSYMIPKDIFVVDRLPRTETGKIKYSEIKLNYEKR